MPRQLHCPALCAILLAILGTSGASAQSPPQVALNTGILEGLRMPATKNEVAFLGVPYAAPPIGNLRWKPSQPPLAWLGTRKAVQFGAACPQLPAGYLPYPAWNEDCLFLNIWTTSLSSKAALPVIVYFHGGSNQVGYSQFHPLGPALSPMGIVVITANYRLGPLGFFALPALTAESPHHSSGNYGLLDQIQALKWVRENIAHFGGNPARITVMGQSAGAFDICLLMASPLARGLFHQAIMESGDCQGTLIKDIRTPIPYNEISGSGEGDGERLAADLGVASGPGLLRKLRSIPADTILKAWSKARSRDPHIQFDAIVDGWVVPAQPATIFAENRQAHESTGQTSRKPAIQITQAFLSGLPTIPSRIRSWISDAPSSSAPPVRNCRLWKKSSRHFCRLIQPIRATRPAVPIINYEARSEYFPTPHSRNQREGSHEVRARAASSHWPRITPGSPRSSMRVGSIRACLLFATTGTLNSDR